LSQLWRVLGSVENVLRMISALVLLSALLGMSTMLLASLRERRGEIAVLRTIGASPVFIFLLVQAEALLLSILGLVTGIALVRLVSIAAREWLRQNYGLLLTAYTPDTAALQLCGAVLVLGTLCAIAPAVGAYRSSLGATLASR